MALQTLRGRLLVGMLGVFSAALTISSFVDAWEARHPAIGARALLPEPYQDALVLAAFAAPALLLIWAVSSWSLRPLARASQQALAIGPQTPTARISLDGLPSEITPLVDAVNGALDRLAKAADAERRFTENAAHELRTPVAVLGLRLQRAKIAQDTPPDWAAIERDLAQMNRLLSRLLHLARAENASRNVAYTDLPLINLARVARETAAKILPLAEAKGRILALHAPENLPVRGQADDVSEALTALLENALLHGDGAISLHAASTATGPVLTIADAGAGVPAGHEESIFERFEKGASSEGSGLGLAIVREIMRQHGGKARARQGPGGVFELSFPAP